MEVAPRKTAMFFSWNCSILTGLTGVCDHESTYRSQRNPFSPCLFNYVFYPTAEICWQIALTDYWRMLSKQIKLFDYLGGAGLNVVVGIIIVIIAFAGGRCWRKGITWLNLQKELFVFSLWSHHCMVDHVRIKKDYSKTPEGVFRVSGTPDTLLMESPLF